MNTIKITILGLLLSSSFLVKAQLFVNEYSCSNISTSADGFGDFNDWVEIYNAGATPVNLAGYYVSDKPTNLTKWQIPSGSVPAGGFRLIYFSGRGLVTGPGQIHPDFTLTQTTNDWIILSNAASVVQDSIRIIHMTKADHAVGRQTNGAATWKLFMTPTPNTTNTGGINFYTTTPTVSVPGGFYAGTQTIIMSCPDAGSTIRYTTDGSVPQATSTLYTGPVTVATTRVVRCRAFSVNQLSLVNTNTYFINIDHTLPVVSIAGANVAQLLGGNQGAAGPGSFELYEQDNSFKDEGMGEFNEHGNDSWAYAQRGFDFIMRDEFGYNNKLKHQIFPIRNRDKFQRLILKPAANDNTGWEPGGAYIRDAYVHHLAQRAELKLDARAWRPCILYLNGAYWGVYEMREKADDHDYTKEYYDQGKYDIQYLKTWGGTWEDYGAPNAAPAWAALRNYVNTNNMGVAANFNYVDARYNWKSLIDYFVINSVTVCTDWLNWNTAWWRGLDPAGDGQRWRYALWDLDATFGHYINYTGVPNTTPSADPCNVEALPNPGGQGHTQILSKLLAENPMVEQYYQARYADLLNTSLSCDFMIPLLDSMINEIQPEMAAQFARWPGPQNASVGMWQANVQTMRNFINARCVQINQGLVDCYSLAGPYDLIVNVDPPLSGEVRVNSVWAPTYPWNASYFGGMNNITKAQANPGFVFDHWTLSAGALALAPTLDSNGINLTGAATLIAHFIPIGTPTFDVIVNVNPPLSGTVTVNSVPAPTYPWTVNLAIATNHAMTTTGNPGFTFSNWTLTNGTIVSPATIANNSFSITGAGTLIANYTVDPIPPSVVTVTVSPIGAGTVSVNAVLAPSYPWNVNVINGVANDNVATPNVGFTFDHWELSSGTQGFATTLSTNTFTVNNAANLVAVFVASAIPPVNLTVLVNPAGAGTVTLNGTLAPAYPWNTSVVNGVNTGVLAANNPGFTFNYWEITPGTLATVNTDINNSINVTTTATLTAFFTPDNVPPVDPPVIIPIPVDFIGVFVPTGFSPNADGKNDLMTINVGNTVKSFVLSIYDRWGNKIFETTEASNPWNGTYKSALVNSGAYAYTLEIKYKDGGSEKKDGNVTIIR